jgi:hypothetical protein
MAKNEARNGQREYGIVHVGEEEMRTAGIGVFATKNRGAAPANKAVTPSADKAERPAATMSQTKDELAKIAKSEGVKIGSDDSKSEIIAKITRARG